MSKPTAHVCAAAAVMAFVATMIFPVVSVGLPRVYSTVGRTWA